MRFCDLGPLVIEVDGGPRSLGGRKPTAALSALLINVNRRVSVDTLVEVLWGRRVPGRAGATLESHIWRLRKVLEPARARGQAPQVLINDNGGYRLLARPDQLDSTRFEELADEVRDRALAPDRALARCDEALALWRSQPYEALQDVDWVVPVRARLDDLRAEVREHRVDALLSLGQSDRALSEATTLIDAAPFRERLWQQRILALYRMGRTEEALQSYQQARRLLRDEIGLEPGPQLQFLQSRILAQDPTLLAAPANLGAPGRDQLIRPNSDRPNGTALPGRGSAFVGRAADLSRLPRLLESQPLVTVAGAAGCGKTRLAVEVAATVSAQFPDGVWFADLASIEQPGLAVEVIISAIGFAAPSVGTAVEGLHSYTRDRRMLIVLDNCEHLLPEIAHLIEAITAGGTQCTLLATSREPTGADGEVVWPLGPLPVFAEETAAATPQGTAEPAASGEARVSQRLSPAAQLFVIRAAAADPTLSIQDEGLELVEAICRAVDGLPLAIELAAARVRSLTLAEIDEQVRSDPSGLRRLGHPALDHRQSLRTAIEWSHQLLSGPEQVVHRRLSVLPGPFTRDAAVAVAGHPPLAPDEVSELLAQLVHRSLLNPLRPARDGRPTLYSQLATVRGHATHALRGAEETEATLRRRNDFVARLLEARPRFSHADIDGWYETVDDAYATVRAVLQQALTTEPRVGGAHLLARLSIFWYYRHRTVEGDLWLEPTRLVAADIAPVDLGQAELIRAAHSFLRARADLAAPHLGAAIELLDQLPYEQATDLVELMGPVALAAESQQDSGSVAAIAASVARKAQDGSDPDISLLAQALSLLAGAGGSATAPPAQLLEKLYESALSNGNYLVAWLTSAAGSAHAEHPEDALIWVDRQAAIQIRLGARDGGIFAERRATYLVLAGRTAEAVSLFSAARLYLRQAGLSWPFLPSSNDLLRQAREALGERQYVQAWQYGEQQPINQLLPSVDLALR